MNILLISLDYPPIVGGIANVSYQTAKSLSKTGDTLVVIAPAIGTYKEFDKQSNLNVLRVPNIVMIRDIVLFFVLSYLVCKRRIDVIYNHTWYPPGVVSCILSILMRIPYVIHVYAMDYFEDRRSFLNKLKYNWLRACIKKLTFNRATKIITLSNYMKDKMIVRGVDALKIAVIPLGVDVARFVPYGNSKEIRKRHRLENNKVLLTVSRLHDYKGHDMVIKVLPRLIKKFPSIAYLIVGRGPYENNLKNLVAELNLSEYVIFAGSVEDRHVSLYYNACDIFIMLSREVWSEAKMEGFGLVFLEAGACGKPVIAGRSGGIEDAVIDQHTGILVNPLNIDEIESAVTKILRDKHFADQLGANGLERIKKEDLSWKNAGQKIREVLCEAKGSNDKK